MKKQTILATTIVILSLALTAFAQTTSDYITLRDKIRGGDVTVDFVKFRHSYMDWLKDPCNKNTEAPDREKMVEAFDNKKWAEAAERGSKVLDYEYGNRGLHNAVAEAYEKSGDTKKSEFHKTVAKKIFEALLKSGDGESPKTAYRVMSIREEYVIMSELGYKVSMQALVSDKEYGMFDVLTGKNEEGKTAEKYFNIDFFFGFGMLDKPCEKDKPAEKPKEG